MAWPRLAQFPSPPLPHKVRRVFQELAGSEVSKSPRGITKEKLLGLCLTPFLDYIGPSSCSRLSEIALPTISVFYGIIIQMYWDEHAPPHFHAIYGDFKAVIDICALEIGKGSLPRRASQLVLDWAELHQLELLEDWDLCQIKQQPKPIEPLK
jgi:hypothetical protein